MSRIGKQRIEIPSGVTVTSDNNLLTVKGPKGVLTLQLPSIIRVNIEGERVSVSIEHEEIKEEWALWGTWASHIKNAIIGVSNGFEKTLELFGVGYKIALQGKKLILNIGFSDPVEFVIPDDLEIAVEKNTMKISGIDKQKVGQIAAEIRSIRKVEPYKGKGIKYTDEIVRRKVGKAAKTAV